MGAGGIPEGGGGIPDGGADPRPSACAFAGALVDGGVSGDGRPVPWGSLWAPVPLAIIG